MLMKGFNEMDGAVGVTQCTVDEGKSFTYKFRIADSQHGTFWYHAHSAVKRADGLYGGLVVHRPVSDPQESDAALYEYDAEKLMLIGDWYHFPAEQVLDQYKDFLSFANEVSIFFTLLPFSEKLLCMDR
jgi:FtsP/CotA-like multicopper oxidase with cupredoxin domain